MSQVAAITCQEGSNRPAKRIKLSHHRRGRSSISILGSVSNIGTTLAGFASRLFSPVGPPNGQFESKPLGPLTIHTPLEQPPWSSPISLLTIMAEEHVNLWEQLEGHGVDVHVSPHEWIGIQSQSRGYSVFIPPRGADTLVSFLDMEDSSSEDSDRLTTSPTTGHSAFSDWDSDSDTDDSDLLDSPNEQSSPSTSSSSLPSPSACVASTGHSFWSEEPTSGDEYWDRQTARLCAKHIRDALPGATSRGLVPLEWFIVDVLRATRGSVREDTAFVALQFIRRLSSACPLDYFEDVFFISFMLADKVESDYNRSLKWWLNRYHGHWSISELGSMERRVLHALDWDLSTSLNCRSSYQTFLAELSSFASI
ncbi:cyclin, putative [Rhizoctonia solani AG-3 Rhs1AP]|uniref:Cyclin, amino-terminal domain protein n=2 Tax=Rhizoctonia solani AG-3 TaxID=1086053 RepID=A0A074SCJ0_9AGAM|nr:cyclin, putative [Rhizoctonia solani AG-3 Rhs1AP]KEP55320.1 cyclin, amino-terminal domain protein [Rhizoctonia solani 123E]